MPNANKAKGDRAERALAETLRGLGFPHTARTRAGHPDDHGDMWLAPGLMAQVKDANVERASYSAWLDATEEQRVAGKADRAILVHKRRGTADPAKWYVVMTVEQMTELLRDAGWGEPRDTGTRDTDTRDEGAA